MSAVSCKFTALSYHENCERNKEEKRGLFHEPDKFHHVVKSSNFMHEVGGAQCVLEKEVKL